MNHYALPAYNEIPDVGLYLKQVVKYINDSIGDNFGFTVTDTMISNYVKMHIVPNPVKKVYYREHIVQFMFVSMAKNVISLDNIKLLMKNGFEKYDTETAYQYFKKDFDDIVASVYEKQSDPSPLPEDATLEQKLLRSTLVTMAHKFYLDASFSEAREQSENSDSSGSDT